EVRIPTGGHAGAAYMKHPHPASRFAVCGVAAAGGLGGTGECTAARGGGTGGGSHAGGGEGGGGGAAGEEVGGAASAGGAPEGGRRHRHQRRSPGLRRVQGASDARLRAPGPREGGRASQGREVAPQTSLRSADQGTSSAARWRFRPRPGRRVSCCG